MTNHRLNSIVFFPINGVGSESRPDNVSKGEIWITGPWCDEEIDVQDFTRVMIFGHISISNCTFIANLKTIIDFSYVTAGNFENNEIKIEASYRDFGEIHLN